MKIIFVTVLSSLFSISASAKDSTFYFQTSDSVELYVRMAGEGKPCVFVHGGPGSTSYYFEAMDAAPALQKKMLMIYFDQRGSGRSGSPANNDYSVVRIEKDLEELRTALGFKKWALMAHSFGGILVTNYAKHFQNSVSALMLIHCTLNINYSMQSHLEFGVKELGLQNERYYRDTTKPLTERVGAVHNLLGEKDIWYKLMFRNAFEKKLNDSVTFTIKPFNRDYAQKVWNEKSYWQDFTSLSKQVGCPVLVMTGEKDYAIGVEHYKSFQFPNQTVVKYMGGHAPFQEEPQWFSEKVLSFTSRL